MKKDMMKKGRRAALQKLREEMRGMEGEGLKKVTVAAPDVESLKEGLDVAKEKVSEMSEMAEDHEESEDESELSDKSKEELLELLKEYMEK